MKIAERKESPIIGLSGMGGGLTSYILYGGSGSSVYEISRSLRFNSADTAYLNRTPSSAGNRRTWTWSGWVKRTTLGTEGGIFSTYAGVHPNTSLFWEVDGLKFHDYTSSYQFRLGTTEKYRDPSAWYHIVLAYDSTESTTSDRAKLWVNGVLQTLSGTTVPLNHQTDWNSVTQHDIGKFASYFDGYMADIHFIDGQALAPTDFGEYDDNNAWQPKEYTGGFDDWFDNSQTWSNGLVSSTGSFDSGRPAVSAFDGDLDDWANPSSGSGSSLTFTPPSTLTYSSSVEIYTLGAGTHSLNGGTAVSHSANTWTTVATGSGTINSLVVTGTNYPAWAATKVDGKLLIDSTFSLSNNSFHLDFSDNSSAAALGTDTSGNSNTWAVNNISVASGADNDSLVDSLTNGTQTDTGAGGEVVGNYATFNPVGSEQNANAPLVNGNLEFATSGYTSACNTFVSTIAVSSGKWYFEGESTNNVGQCAIGIIGARFVEQTANNARLFGQFSDGYAYEADGGNKANNDTSTAYGSAWRSPGNIVGCAFDADNGTLEFFFNGVSQGVAFSSIPQGSYYLAIGVSKGSSAANQGMICTFGQRPFAYTAPSGYKALCTANLSDPTIADGSTAMDTTLYTGNGSTQSISVANHSPDLVWVKARSATTGHRLFDTVRGDYKFLESNSTIAEATNTNQIAITSSGFDTGSSVNTNDNGDTYVAWTWDAGTSTVSNTDGSITSSVRANPTAGFSIVSWTGGTNPGSIGHGLGVSPELIITKQRDDGTSGWYVYHKSLGAGAFLRLDSTNTSASSTTAWDNTTPSSTVIYFDSTGTNPSGDNIAYCFAPVNQYSSFGSYVANNSTDGPMVFTNFRPAFVMIKASVGTSTSNTGWVMQDSSRGNYNVINAKQLYANRNYQEGLRGDGSSVNPQRLDIDFLSNGFKLRNIGDEINATGYTYIYAAFAEHPFRNARAR